MAAIDDERAVTSSRSIGWKSSLATFLDTDPQTVLGSLAHVSAANFSQLAARQTNAWVEQIEVLRGTALTLVETLPPASSWQIVLEYDIPRRGKRIDAVVVTDAAVMVLEFKVGTDTFDAAAQRQVEDYALELKDFHDVSTASLVLPVLVATKAPEGRPIQAITSMEDVPAVTCTNADRLSATVLRLYKQAIAVGVPIDPVCWVDGRYQPTPTIIEAARYLYAHHEVSAITRTDAETSQLERTRQAIENCVAQAQASKQHVICFVSGVPGAGKTLVGLNAAVALKQKHLAGKAVYLSGNGPLVKVLQESLARDQHRRQRAEGVTKSEASKQAGQFVQNVHQFINHYLEHRSHAPDAHVVVFDEAQRAWSKEHAFRKFNRDESEPASMIGIMNRHTDWAVIVGLIGCGQEINTGEAGLAEWFRTIDEHYPDWRVHVAEETDIDAFAKFRQRSTGYVTVNPSLHLRTSMRSYRGMRLASWVEHVLAGDAEQAAASLTQLKQFPIVLTRSLVEARTWLRDHARGERRPGLIASSGAQRLRRFGVDVGSRVDVAHWFLGSYDDVRSSYALEQAATEFDIQGLELDWIGVCWGADLRWNGRRWEHWRFRGNQWQNIRKDDARQYLVNKYRVLLTRARQGMLIWVPQGESRDRTAPPEYYEHTAAHLQNCGIAVAPSL